jgi:hypothetical protein
MQAIYFEFGVAILIDKGSKITNWRHAYTYGVGGTMFITLLSHGLGSIVVHIMEPQAHIPSYVTFGAGLIVCISIMIACFILFIIGLCLHYLFEPCFPPSNAVTSAPVLVSETGHGPLHMSKIAYPSPIDIVDPMCTPPSTHQPIHKVRMYCITEDTHHYVWTVSVQTVCPINVLHAIDLDSVTIVESILGNKLAYSPDQSIMPPDSNQSTIPFDQSIMPSDSNQSTIPFDQSIMPPNYDSLALPYAPRRARKTKHKRVV